jgi:hypothetical protein
MVPTNFSSVLNNLFYAVEEIKHSVSEDNISIGSIEETLNLSSNCAKNIMSNLKNMFNMFRDLETAVVDKDVLENARDAVSVTGYQICLSMVNILEKLKNNLTMLNIYVAKTLSNFEEYNEQQIDYQKIRQETYRMVDYITGLVSEKEYKVDEYMKIDNMEDIRNFNSQIRNVVKEEYKETENEK